MGHMWLELPTKGIHYALQILNKIEKTSFMDEPPEENKESERERETFLCLKMP